MARVELEKVEKRFGDVVVVKELSFAIEAGEFLVLVGPSGCGKSTTLRMIAGLEGVSSGTIRIGDRVVNDVAPKDRNIGMVFQSYALYPHMTVRENLGFGLSLQRMDKQKIAARIEEAAEILELGALLDRRPKQLSGGQRQRVAIGRAIVKDPQLFLFDEPLSNLDAALRVQMRTELGALHHRLKTTMVYVTHDQVEAMMLADRIAVLNGGDLMQIGAPLELYQRPRNRFVAGFIGSPAMNFLKATLSGRGGAAEVEFAGISISVPGIAESSGPLEVGIRPQDIVFGSGDIRGEVLLIEKLGWEAFVHVELGDERVLVRVEGPRAEEITVGSQAMLGIEPSAVHVFADSGESIWCGAAR